MDFELDHYDLFNAPQYVDFNELVKNDKSCDEDVDKFFETHREEDDFFLPSAVSPNPVNISEAAKQYDEVYDIEAHYRDQPESPQQEISHCESAGNASSHEVEQSDEYDCSKNVDANCEDNIKEECKPVLQIESLTCDHESTNLSEEVKGPSGECSATSGNLPNTESQLVQHNGGNEGGSEEVRVIMEEHHGHVTAQYCYQGAVVGDRIMAVESMTLEKNLSPNGYEPAIRKKKISVETSTTCVATDVASIKQEVQSNAKPLPAPQTTNAKEHIHIKKPSVKITVPQPFNFSKLRAKRAQDTDKETESYHFKAHPVPVKVLHGDTALPARQPPKTTQPVEIHFASDDRIKQRHLNASRKSVPANPTQKPASAAARTGRSSVKRTNSSCGKASSDSINSESGARQRFRSRSSSMDSSKPPTPTRVIPFSFENRDRELLRKKQEKIMKAIEAESKVKEFHAQPVPNYTSSLKRLPKKKQLGPTVPEPFKLKSDVRGAAYQETIHRKLEEEERRLKEQTVFHAQPNEVIYKKPFEPMKAMVPLPEAVDPTLNTDKRAEERAKFDEMIRQKEAELEELRKQEQLMKEMQELKLAQTMRQQSVHKAKPAPKPRFFEVKNSGKELTDPKSPAFEPLPSQRRRKQSNKENVAA